MKKLVLLLALSALAVGCGNQAQPVGPAIGSAAYVAGGGGPTLNVGITVGN